MTDENLNSQIDSNSTPDSVETPVGSGRTRARVNSWEGTLKELVTTTIALIVLGLSTWMLILVFLAAHKPEVIVESVDVSKPGLALYQEREKRRLEKRAAEKDILLVTLGLFGSVLGYYFGRVPAEHRADTAETAAEMAQQRADNDQKGRENAENKVRDARATAQQILDTLKRDHDRRQKLRNLQGVDNDRQDTNEIDQTENTRDQLNLLLNRLEP